LRKKYINQELSIAILVALSWMIDDIFSVKIIIIIIRPAFHNYSISVFGMEDILLIWNIADSRIYASLKKKHF
jgi:hypothetical protein